jgi:hypothetical protein
VFVEKRKEKDHSSRIHKNKTEHVHMSHGSFMAESRMAIYFAPLENQKRHHLKDEFGTSRI